MRVVGLALVTMTILLRVGLAIACYGDRLFFGGEIYDIATRRIYQGILFSPE